MFLITYVCDGDANFPFRYDTTDDPIEWQLIAEKYSEIYIIINVIPLTEDQFNRIDGNLKGMYS